MVTLAPALADAGSGASGRAAERAGKATKVASKPATSWVARSALVGGRPTVLGAVRNPSRASRVFRPHAPVVKRAIREVRQHHGRSLARALAQGRGWGASAELVIMDARVIPAGRAPETIELDFRIEGPDRHGNVQQISGSAQATASGKLHRVEWNDNPFGARQDGR
jgi:hypothetical protein